MIQKITLPGTDAVRNVQPGAKENFVVCDLPGFAEFADQVPRAKRWADAAEMKWYGGIRRDGLRRVPGCGALR